MLPCGLDRLHVIRDQVRPHPDRAELFSYGLTNTICT